MALGDKVVDAAASTLTPGTPGGKDSYDLVVQQRFANDPDMLKKLNDPVVKKILMAAMGDAFVKGNEELIGKVIPGLLEKINVAQIDLSKENASERIKAEADKAKQYYAGWLAQQQAQAEIEKKRADASVSANTTGFLTYEKGAAGWAGLMRFVTAVVDAFQQGSMQPIKDFVAEFSTPKDLRIQTADASMVRAAPGNAYASQNPVMPGASSVPQLGAATESPNPVGALTGNVPPQLDAGTSPVLLRENSRSVTTPTAGSRRTDPPAKPAIKFGGKVPTLEPQ